MHGTDYPTPDGTAIRDYLHVRDLADAHARALEHLEPGTHRIHNLGSGGGYSVREVLDAVRRVTGHPVPVVDGPRRAGDPAVLVAANDRAPRRTRLGAHPRPGRDRRRRLGVHPEAGWAREQNVVRGRAGSGDPLRRDVRS